MEYLIYVIIFIIDAAVSGIILWLAAKVTNVDLFVKETIIAVSVASILALIPSVGWLLSLIALFYLLKKFSQASIWPDLILMVIVSRFFSFLAIVFLGGL